MGSKSSKNKTVKEKQKRKKNKSNGARNVYDPVIHDPTGPPPNSVQRNLSEGDLRARTSPPGNLPPRGPDANRTRSETDAIFPTTVDPNPRTRDAKTLPSKPSDTNFPNDRTYEQPESSTYDAPNKSPYQAPASYSKPSVRGTIDYEASYESDISFKMGDVMDIITDEVDGWYFVKHVKSLQEGHVPIGKVTKIFNESEVRSHESFYDVDRDDAEEFLENEDVQLGTYLIRPSNEDGYYAISVLCENGKNKREVRHYKIKIVERGVCYLEKEEKDGETAKPFGSITELIKYYSRKPGLQSKLTKPYTKPFRKLLEEIEIQISDLKFGNKLGSGNFAKVYKGTLYNSQSVAVKSLREGGSMSKKDFLEEAEVMHKLKHERLVTIIGICVNDNQVHIVTEMMSRGALKDLLLKDGGKGINFSRLMNMAIQIAEGMSFLNCKSFVHRDLRAANVLAAESYDVKIADFGLARLLDQYYEHEDFYLETKGTAFPFMWTAPEAVAKKQFTVKSDVWSFGILLYEMVTYGEEIYQGMSNHEAVKWVRDGNRLEKPTGYHCPLALYNIMKQCWLTNPDERPTFEYIRENLLEINASPHN